MQGVEALNKREAMGLRRVQELLVIAQVSAGSAHRQMPRCDIGRHQREQFHDTGLFTLQRMLLRAQSVHHGAALCLAPQ